MAGLALLLPVAKPTSAVDRRSRWLCVHWGQIVKIGSQYHHIDIGMYIIKLNAQRCLIICFIKVTKEG